MNPSTLDTPARPHPWDGYLSGPENALALASARALAEGSDEGRALSPLVVHGPSGSGKSRLLAGLVAERLRRRPGSAVAHLEAETFAALCAEAAERPAGWADLRARFRNLDLLVLDDLHALLRAPLALAELAHALDALDDAGASVALSAQAPPSQWTPGPSAWPRRLLSRLLAGLSVRLDPPGLESRRRYVLDAARARALRLSADAVEHLALRADGYRTLDGWLTRLALALRLDPASPTRPLNPSQIDALLADDPAGLDPEARLDRLARAVARRFGVPLRDLRSTSRRQALVLPRHLAIHLARRLTNLSYARLGAYFGGRDPKTIRHACASAARRLAADPALAAALAPLASDLETLTPDA